MCNRRLCLSEESRDSNLNQAGLAPLQHVCNCMYVIVDLNSKTCLLLSPMSMRCCCPKFTATRLQSGCCVSRQHICVKTGKPASTLAWCCGNRTRRHPRLSPSVVAACHRSREIEGVCLLQSKLEEKSNKTKRNRPLPVD